MSIVYQSSTHQRGLVYALRCWERGINKIMRRSFFLQGTLICVPLCVVVRFSGLCQVHEGMLLGPSLHPAPQWPNSTVMKHMSSTVGLPRFASWLCSYLLCGFGQDV